MSLRLNGSTSGYVEIDAPAVASNNTLRLPTTNGTDGSVLQVDSTGQLAWRDGNSLGAGFKNAIINGGFDVWQRGTTFANAAEGVYHADRWVTTYNGTSTARTIERSNFLVGSNEAHPGAEYYLAFRQTAAGSGANYNTLNQRIENVRTFQGQTVTLSFYARAWQTQFTMPSIALRQHFGSGGSASVDTAVVVNAVIGTGFTRYTYTVTLPSITGKTVGTNNYLELIFFLPINALFELHVSGVQLEPGTVATTFERRSYGQELALCQRYFQLAGNGCFGAVDGSTSTVIAFSEKFFVPMRVAPTVTWRTGGTANWRYAGGDLSNGGTTSLANTISSANAVWSQQTGFASLTANLPVWSRNQTSTGEFMACNAEL